MIQNEVSLGGSPTINVTLQATLIGALDIRRIDLLIRILLSSDLPYLVPKRITINTLAIFSFFLPSFLRFFYLSVHPLPQHQVDPKYLRASPGSAGPGEH